MLVKILIPQIFVNPCCKSKKKIYSAYELPVGHSHINNEMLFLLRLDILNCVDVVYEILMPNIYEMSVAIFFIENILMKHVEYFKYIEKKNNLH